MDEDRKAKLLKLVLKIESFAALLAEAAITETVPAHICEVSEGLCDLIEPRLDAILETQVQVTARIAIKG
jgi:hypothetical protein